MRFYKIWYPGRSGYVFCTNLRKLDRLPEGTEIQAVATDRSGQETDAWNIPVVNGRAKPRGRTLYGRGTFRMNGPQRGTVKP